MTFARSALLSAVALCTLAGSACDRGLDPETAAATITADDFYTRISVLAADSMRGRDTPSPELDQAAAWIAEEFRAMGLQPAGAGDGFLQTYPIRTSRPDLDASSISSSTGATAAYGESAVPAGAVGGAAEGAVVVVTADATEASLQDLDPSGHHVVFVGATDEREAPMSSRRVQRWAAENGALSVLLASSADDDVWARIRSRADRERATLGDGPDGPPVVQVRDAALGGLLGVDIAAARSGGSTSAVRVLDGLTLSVDQRVDVTETSAPNVVAVLPGSDPELRDEYVVFSGHMDHVGVGRPDETGDSIYNGADDDASGTVAVMEVAEAMASLETAPRRSMLFLLVSGEEKGLWGSGYYAENPTVPAEGLVANFNTDMVGRNWPDTIVAIGREHSDLGETLARVNEAHPEIGMTAIDDLWPEENFYGRSDHYNFARIGVPILFFFNGTHEDYHRPSDEVDAIDTEKAARIAKLVYWLGMEVGNADARPQWNPESYEEIVGG